MKKHENLPPKDTQNDLQNQRKSTLGAPRDPQDPPKRLKDAPVSSKTPPRDPKCFLKASKMAPKINKKLSLERPISLDPSPQSFTFKLYVTIFHLIPGAPNIPRPLPTIMYFQTVYKDL